MLARTKNGVPYRYTASVPKHVEKFNIEKVATKVQSFTLRKPLTNINKTKPNLAANNCKVFPPKQSAWHSSKSIGGKVNVYQRSEKSLISKATEERIMKRQEKRDVALNSCPNKEENLYNNDKIPPIQEKKYRAVDNTDEPDVEDMPDEGPCCQDFEQKQTTDKKESVSQVGKKIDTKNKECQSAPLKRSCDQESDVKDDLKASYSQSKLESRPPSAELAPQASGDSIPTNGSDSDEELRKIAMADQHEEDSLTKSPDNLQVI